MLHDFRAFIMAVVGFLIIAFAVFMLVRHVNKAKDMVSKKKQALAEKTPAGRTELDLLTEIRDALVVQ